MLRAAVLAALLVAAVRGQVQVTVPESGFVSIQSENFPEAYSDNLQQTWIVTGPVGSALEFNSDAFSTEDRYDSLSIIDNGETLFTFSGSVGPSDSRTKSNQVTVTFTTDSSVQRTGFSVRIRVAKCPFGVGRCPNHEDVCLPSAGWCNGAQDCPDGVDEQCPDLSDCGRSTVQPQTQSRGHKIVGGIEAIPHSWPWQVALLSTSNFQFCGGSVISNRWIMSAAHCCAGRGPASIRVRVGAHNLRSNSEGAETLEVERVINHPRYSTSPATNNDFCLIKTKNPIQFSRQVAAVCLPDATGTLEINGTEAYITGWGTTRSGGSSSSVLLQTLVRVSDQATCNTAYGGDITPQMICGAFPGRDTCQGDSGGPFVVRGADGRFQLVGVTSWGRGCAMAGYPGIYARTSTALAWIAETITQN